MRKKPQITKATPQRGSILLRHQKTREIILFFLSFWLTLSAYYGEVMYTARQYSFFSTDCALMEFVTAHQPYGSLWYVGRALLQTFRYPWFGGALTAVMMTLIALMLQRSWKMDGKLRPLTYLPAYIWLAILFYNGFDNYFQAETGMILGIPFCVFVILLLQTLFVLTFKRHKKPGSTISLKAHTARLTSLLLLPAALMLAEHTARPYVRITAHLQCALEREDWQEIRNTAKECGVSARPIAAYYAIALSQTGTLLEELFDIEYNYADIHLHNRNGEKDYGTRYYEADCNLHAGLLNSAYRSALEEVTMEGPSIRYLRIMAEAALLNNEHKLCRKYLNILATVPFEQDFVARTERLLQDPELTERDRRFSIIRKYIPTDENFETFLRSPAFLGYNTTLLSGRSYEALQASIAACLYSKQMPQALMRMEPLAGHGPLPRTVREALVILASKQPQIAQSGLIHEADMRKYQLFLQMAKQNRQSMNREACGKALREHFLGYYPYYYYYGNLNATKAPQTEKTEKQQVN